MGCCCCCHTRTRELSLTSNNNNAATASNKGRSFPDEARTVGAPSSHGNTNDATTTTNLSPREAAGRAAEQRAALHAQKNGQVKSGRRLLQEQAEQNLAQRDSPPVYND